MVPPSQSWLWKKTCLRAGKPADSPLCRDWESWEEESWNDESIAEWLSLRPYDSAKECLSARDRLFKAAELIDVSTVETDLRLFNGKQLADADKDLAQTMDSLYQEFDNNALGELYETSEFDAQTWVDHVDPRAMEIPARRWRAAKCIGTADPRLAR